MEEKALLLLDADADCAPLLSDAAACLGKPLRPQELLSTMKDVSQHYGLTSDRWGSLIPPPVKKWMETKERFRGIAKKLSPTKRRDNTKSQT